VRILDHLSGPQGQQAIENMAASFGVEPKDAKAALTALFPVFSRAIERNTLNRGGIADVVSELGKANAAGALAPGANLASPAVTAQGIEFLENLLGSKDKSRAVASRVARETGVSEDVIKTMLPAAAAMTMGALAEGSRSQLQDIMGRVPGLAAADTWAVPGAGEGSLPRQTPLPIPGDTLPEMTPRRQSPGRYDDLSDVIRRGGTSVPKSGGSGSGPIGGNIRDILGDLMGFKNRGFMGWLLQAVVLPMVLRFIQSLLRRVLSGR